LTATDYGPATIDTLNDNATVTIADNDAALVSISANDPAAGEPADPGQFTVTLSSVSSTDTTVSYTVTGTATDGADYTALSGTVTIFAGATTATIDVTVLDDALVESLEDVVVTLAGITAGDADITVDAVNDTATVSILDDDAASVTINDVVINEGAGTATLTVTLGGNVAGGFSVDYASADGSASAGSDYTATSGTLNFLGNNGETQSIVVPITNDGLLEGSETLTLTLSNLSNALVTFSDDTGQVTINDDDIALVSIAATAPASEPAANGQFTVTLSSASSTDTTVSYTVTGTATDGSDYSALSGTVTILAGTTTATIDVTVLDDTLFEGSEDVVVTLAGITAGDADITVDGANDTATVNILDDETATPVVPNQNFSVDENSAVGTIVGVVTASDVEADTYTKMYWVDEANDSIYRANLDGSALELLVTGLGDPVDLAIDFVGGKMYWVDSLTGKVQRANLDGTGIQDLYNGADPRGIALDLAADKMYWTDTGTNMIQRANLDGSNVENLVTVGVSGPRGITLDLNAGKMYWADLTSNDIKRANLDGSSVEVVVSGLGDPRGVALDLAAGKVYWADTGANKSQHGSDRPRRHHAGSRGGQDVLDRLGNGQDSARQPGWLRCGRPDNQRAHHAPRHRAQRSTRDPDLLDHRRQHGRRLRHRRRHRPDHRGLDAPARFRSEPDLQPHRGSNGFRRQL
jgi:sugar lactone lactonase YvrE